MKLFPSLEYLAATTGLLNFLHAVLYEVKRYEFFLAVIWKLNLTFITSL